jgi:hypothetical protein
VTGQDFGATRTVKARKTHQCEECWRTITPGELYARHAGSWEGDFFTNVACGHCAELRRIIDSVDPYYFEGYYGGVSEWVSQNMHQELDATVPWFTKLSLLRLTRQYQRKWATPSGGLEPLPRSASNE